MFTALRKLCCCYSGDSFMDDADMVGHYSGEKNCFRQRHGYGTCMLANGDIYEGCWKYDLMEGFGKYTFKNGEIMEGYFKDGEYIGKTLSSSFSSSGYHPKPFAQTIKEDEERRQREIEHKQKREKGERLREEGKRRREEFRKKYGSIANEQSKTKAIDKLKR